MAAPWVVSDELWSRIESLLPARPASRTGPKPLPDRLVLQGILFVLYTGIGWEDMPQELGFRLRDDLLAAVTRPDRGRRVRPAAPEAARRAERGRPD